MKRLSKEELGLRAKFNFREKELPLPELGHEDAGILLRSPSLEALHSIEVAADKRDDEDRGISSPDVIATLLSVYSAEPKLSKEEWLEIVKGWPSATLSSIYEAITEVAGKTEEESRALATEFRDSAD